MAKPKPRYDDHASWKTRQFDGPEWDALQVRIQKKLRPFYPDADAVIDPTFGHPADAWANGLLHDAEGGASMMLWLRRSLPKEEQRAEIEDLLRTLRKAAKCLGTVSFDVARKIDISADVLGCRDKILELIPFVEAVSPVIEKMPQAMKLADAQHDAAMEMTIRVLHTLEASGVSIAATANKKTKSASQAVKILKAIGDEIELVFAESTWRDKVLKARKLRK